MSNVIYAYSGTRRDTSTNWNASLNILKKGEMAIETDTGKVKVGDGVTVYALLPYTDELPSTLGYNPADEPDDPSFFNVNGYIFNVASLLEEKVNIIKMINELVRLLKETKQMVIDLCIRKGVNVASTATISELGEGIKVAVKTHEFGTNWIASNFVSTAQAIEYDGKGTLAAGVTAYTYRGLYTSTDKGKTWNETTFAEYILDIKYVFDKWFIMTSDSVYYTTDMLTFTNTNIPAGTKMYIVNGKLFVMNNTLYYTSDGENWLNTTSTEFNLNGNSMASNGKVYIISSALGITYSDDLVSWYESSLPPGCTETGFIDCTYANNLFIAASSQNSGLIYSNDGKAWGYDEHKTGAYKFIRYENNIWFSASVDTGKIVYSRDGKKWKETDSYPLSNAYEDLRYANGRYFAFNKTTVLYVSKDIVNWVPTRLISSKITRLHVYDNDQIYLVSGNKIYYPEI